MLTKRIEVIFQPHAFDISFRPTDTVIMRAHSKQIACTEPQFRARNVKRSTTIKLDMKISYTKAKRRTCKVFKFNVRFKIWPSYVVDYFK